MQKKMAVSLLVAALFTSPLFAQEKGKHDSEEHHKQWASELDADGDGKISKEEYLKAAEERFNKMDKGGDGFIDAEDQQSMKEKMKERMEKMHEKMKEGAAQLREGADKAVDKFKEESPSSSSPQAE